MKKRELVYLHALLAEVRRFLEAREELPPRHFEDYEEYGVGPTAIHRPKDEHAEASQLLLDDLVAALRRDHSEAQGEDTSIASR